MISDRTARAPAAAKRRWHRCLAAIGLTVLLARAHAAEPLSRISDIRALSPGQAETGLPVRLRATVTYSKPSIDTLFLHDGSAGIFVEQTAGDDKTGLKPGDQVDVLGITGRGMFANVIRRSSPKAPYVTKVGSGALPEPRSINGNTLLIPELDCEFVSIQARVREVYRNDGDLILACQANARDFHVLMEGPLPLESVPWDLAETRIRVRGVAATTFNAGRQMTGRFLRVSSLADISRIDPEAPDSMEAPLVRADELLQVGGPDPNQLVRIRGVATMSLPGRGLFLQVEGGGLWVQTAQPVAAPPGTVIEVLGWPRPGELKPFLRARRATVIGSTVPPAPRQLKVSEVLDPGHDGEWVSVDAELLDSFRGPEGIILELRDEEVVFRGQIPFEARRLPAHFDPGSRLRVRGIAQVSASGDFTLRVADKLTILARSSLDVEQLAPPPFWTARNVAIVSTLLIVGSFGLFTLARLRRIREQRTQRREFEAVLAERGRFAREIHDSLAQGLTSISLQLECAREHLADDPSLASDHIERARSLVRDSLKEARRTVWNLRPLALGEADLAGSLQRFADNLTADGRITCRQEIEGTPRPLPPDHESALLRIGQEALTNAIRHAGASEVRQRLRFGNGWVTLTVMDNGKGFDVGSMVGKGFGLTGMHERTAALGGSLSIDSRPGQGTEVSATLPV